MRKYSIQLQKKRRRKHKAHDMSAVVRDVWRYHHWPTQKSFWSRQYTSPGILTHRSAPEADTQPQGVSGDYVGYDHKISPQNLERVRYHHWPERRHKRNPIWENVSLGGKEVSLVFWIAFTEFCLNSFQPIIVLALQHLISMHCYFFSLC